MAAAGLVGAPEPWREFHEMVVRLEGASSQEAVDDSLCMMLLHDSDAPDRCVVESLS
jgi:hypothetical protein